MAPTLYYTPISCGMANFISAHKAGLIQSGKLNAEQVDLGKKVVLSGPKSGSDYLKINPKGNVPTIVFESGTIINENVATLIWIAEQNPEAKLLPAPGTEARFVAISKLGWIATELHQTMGALFNPNIGNEVKNYILAKLDTKLTYLNNIELADGRKFLAADGFTVVDAYSYIVLSWAQHLAVDLSKYERVQRYYEGIKDIECVKKAHEAANK